MHGIRSIERLRLTAIISWVVLCLQMLVGVSATGRVLCVAADGHVAVELAHVGRCVREVSRHHGGHLDTATAVAGTCDAHPCEDVVLDQPVLRVTPQGPEKIVAAAIATTAHGLPGTRLVAGAALAFRTARRRSEHDDAAGHEQAYGQ